MFNSFCDFRQSQYCYKFNEQYKRLINQLTECQYFNFDIHIKHKVFLFLNQKHELKYTLTTMRLTLYNSSIERQSNIFNSIMTTHKQQSFIVLNEYREAHTTEQNPPVVFAMYTLNKTFFITVNKLVSMLCGAQQQKQ